MTDPELKGLSRFRGISREQCGIIVRNKNGSFSIVPVRNESKNPDAYEISEESVQKVEGWLFPGESIIGFFHTHLEHHPLEVSDADWEGAAKNPGLIHVIYKPSTRETMWYSHEED